MLKVVLIAYALGVACGSALAIVFGAQMAASMADEHHEGMKSDALELKKDQGICLVDVLNVREGPTTDSRVVTQMKLCAIATMIDYPNHDVGDWVQVQFQEFIGWVYRQYFSPVSKQDLCIGFTMAAEGGYSTIREDPGNWTHGMVGHGQLKGTKFGISAFAYPDLNIEDLTRAEAYQIYLDDWYKPLGIDGVPWPMALYRFDTAVNIGKTGEAYLFGQYMQGEDEYLLHRIRRHQAAIDSPFTQAWATRVYRLRTIGKAFNLSEGSGDDL